MTQFQQPYVDPYMSQTGEAPKTSGLAITALVLSLLGIIPCLGLVTAPIGAICGLIAIPTIGSNPMRKGKGLAVAAIVLGVVFAGAQAYGGKLAYDFFYGFVEIVMKGPEPALKAGFSGDVAGFRSQFVGAGATATDAEAKAFLDQLRARYGEFVSSKFDEQSGSPPQGRPGQPSVPFPYILTFKNGTANAEVEVVFADQKTGAFVKKLGYITVFDPVQGELTYPPSAAGSGSTTAPSGSQGG